MSYDGYRIKIEGIKVENTWITRGTWGVSSEERIADTYTDANLVEHVITTGEYKKTIEFSIREHDAAEHKEIMKILKKRTNISVTYWDDMTGEYSSGIFRMESVKFAHKNAGAGSIEYQETGIKLIEN